MEFKTYDYKQFHYVDGFINIPQYALFYRGVSFPGKSKIDILRKNIPIYLSSKDIALTRYANKDHKDLYCISNSEALKLLDIRKITNLLPMLIDSYKFDKNDNDYINAINCLSISLGIVDLNIQIQLLNNFINAYNITEKPFLDGFKRVLEYKQDCDELKKTRGPLNKEGIRFALTNFDGQSIFILKELFGGFCDGFIAPRLTSPMQEDLFTHEEIVVFDTNILRVIDEPDNIKKVPIKELIKINNIELSFPKINLKAYMIKGGGSSERLIQDRNEFFNDKKRVKAAMKIAKKFAKSFVVKKKKKSCEPIIKESFDESPNKKIYTYPPIKLNLPEGLWFTKVSNL